MFVLAEMQDMIRIEPRRFARAMEQEIVDELNKKFANKVRLKLTADLHTDAARYMQCHVAACARRWCTRLGYALRCLTSLTWENPTSSLGMEPPTPKVG